MKEMCACEGNHPYDSDGYPFLLHVYILVPGTALRVILFLYILWNYYSNNLVLNQAPPEAPQPLAYRAPNP